MNKKKRKTEKGASVGGGWRVDRGRGGENGDATGGLHTEETGRRKEEVRGRSRSIYLLKTPI